MAKVLSWDEVRTKVEATTIVVYAEFVDEGFVFIGPIVSFTQEGGSAAFRLRWCAVKEGCDSDSPWQSSPDTEFSYEKKKVIPSEKEPGRIFFKTQTGGATIYLDGRKVLDPANVVGIDPRFLQQQG